MTEKEFFKRVKGILRSELQDNFIEDISNNDLETAFDMTISRINIWKPMTNFTKEDLLSDELYPVWFAVILDGVAYYALTAQISEWMHNGMDISIDQLSIQDKMDSYITVADRFKDEFESLLEQIKSGLQTTKLRYLIRDVDSVTGGGPSSVPGFTSFSYSRKRFRRR